MQMYMKTAVLLSLTVFLSSATLGVIPCGGPCAVGAECIQGKCILVSQQYTNNIQYSSSYSPYSTYNIYPWQVYNNPVEYPQANLYPCSLPCAYGYKCYQGKCVPESIAGSYYSGCYPGCPHGYKCYNGKCEILMDICGGCTPPLYCGSSGICQNPYNPLPTVDNCGGCQYPQVCGPQNVCLYQCSNYCPTGFQCISGLCHPKTANTNTGCGFTGICPQGTYCSANECVPYTPNIQVCGIQGSYTVKQCTNPRPNEQTCPTIYYAFLIPPQSRFCGVRSDGTRVNFVQQCSACKDSSIDYYFTQPCDKAPVVCPQGSYCTGNTCQKYSEAGQIEPTCQTSQECPYDWQICYQNRCTDLCKYSYCANCYYGQCGYQFPTGICNSNYPNSCSNSSWSCVNGQCVDLCAKKACPPYHFCRNGICYPRTY